MRYGKCTNFGLCTKADTREAQAIPDGTDFSCQECKRALTPVGGTAPSSGGGPGTAILIAIVLAVLAAGAGFYLLRSRGSSSSSSNGPATSSNIPVVGNTTALLTLSGSNTIGSQLAPDLVMAWLNSQNATGVSRRPSGEDEVTIRATFSGSAVIIKVNAHGSGTAFADLGAGACDLGMASRKITAAEASSLQSKGLGDLTSNGGEKVLGLDGVAVIVNEANNVDTLTKDEVATIFSRGAGPGQSWNVYARDDKSGTFDTFRDRVLGTRRLSPTATRFEDSRQLASAVGRDRNGIGFVGLPYAVGVKTLAIAERGAMPLVPNTMTIRTEAYPLSRRLYLYVPENAKPEAREFAAFALSPAGQDVVEKDGFVGQKIDVVKPQTPAVVPSAYSQQTRAADRLSLDFRFRTGSADLDTKAVDDIKRLAAALGSEYRGRGVMLVGFADNVGNPASNVRLSTERARAVAGILQRQGITAEATGLGQELPVADNSTPEGREKNRRVEVWLRK